MGMIKAQQRAAMKYMSNNSETVADDPARKVTGFGKQRRWRKMNEKLFEYEEVIRPADRSGAYVPFPYDIRAEFGKGRVKVRATFDGEPYDGYIVNMGVKNADGSVCYIIGILKEIRSKIKKQPGDAVRVTIRERE